MGKINIQFTKFFDYKFISIRILLWQILRHIKFIKNAIKQLDTPFKQFSLCHCTFHLLVSNMRPEKRQAMFEC